MVNVVLTSFSLISLIVCAPDAKILVIHQVEVLTNQEKVLRDTIEEKIYSLTKYDPILDSKDDRGEVKSLAYFAVKDLLYFAAHEQGIGDKKSLRILYKYQYNCLCTRCMKF